MQKGGSSQFLELKILHFKGWMRFGMFRFCVTFGVNLQHVGECGTLKLKRSVMPSPLFWSPFCSHSPGEYWRVYGASILINDGESGPGVLGHGHATPSKYSVGRLVRDIDPECQLVTDPDSVHLLTPWVQDGDPWGRGLRSWCDTQVWSLTQFFSVGFLLSVKRVLFTDVLSRSVSIVFDTLLGTFQLAQHTWWYLSHVLISLKFRKHCARQVWGPLRNAVSNHEIPLRVRDQDIIEQYPPWWGVINLTSRQMNVSFRKKET